MKKSLLALAFVLAASVAARAAAFVPPLFYGFGPITTPGTVTEYLSGSFCLAGSSNTAGTCGILLDRGAGVNASSGSFVNGVTASSGTFTATGAGQLSVVTSSGVSVANGDIAVPNGCIKLKSGVNCGAAPGDVSQAGNNTFTGTNVFNGKVQASTGTTITFAPGAYTTTQTTFLTAVTGSTMSFTVQGSTVGCWLSGNVSINSGSQNSQANVGVDGQVNKVPGTSISIGLTNALNTSISNVYQLNFYYEFQVSAGANHAFYLTLTTTGGTLTFPSSTAPTAVSQFGCREVLSR